MEKRQGFLTASVLLTQVSPAQRGTSSASAPMEPSLLMALDHGSYLPAIPQGFSQTCKCLAVSHLLLLNGQSEVL